MISMSGTIWYNDGEWRYTASVATVHCDADGCGATAVVKGLEHNGAAIEHIYLDEKDKEWSLGEHDYCPTHEPEDGTESS